MAGGGVLELYVGDAESRIRTKDPDCTFPNPPAEIASDCCKGSSAA